MRTKGENSDKNEWRPEVVASKAQTPPAFQSDDLHLVSYVTAIWAKERLQVHLAPSLHYWRVAAELVQATISREAHTVDIYNHTLALAKLPIE